MAENAAPTIPADIVNKPSAPSGTEIPGFGPYIPTPNDYVNPMLPENPTLSGNQENSIIPPDLLALFPEATQGDTSPVTIPEEPVLQTPLTQQQQESLPYPMTVPEPSQNPIPER